MVVKDQDSSKQPYKTNDCVPAILIFILSILKLILYSPLDRIQENVL